MWGDDSSRAHGGPPKVYLRPAQSSLRFLCQRIYRTHFRGMFLIPMKCYVWRKYSMYAKIVNWGICCRNIREPADMSLCTARINAEWRYREDISANTNWANAQRGWSRAVTVTKNSFSIRSVLITRNAVDSQLHAHIVVKPRCCLERISRFTWRIIAPRTYFPVHSRTPAAASRYYLFAHHSLYSLYKR